MALSVQAVQSAIDKDPNQDSRNQAPNNAPSRENYVDAADPSHTWVCSFNANKKLEPGSCL